MYKFAVISSARSGSTVLCSTLDRHSEIVSHGEVFGQRNILRISHNFAGPAEEKRWTVAERDADVPGFITAHTEGVPGRVMGFKLLLSHLDPRFVHFPQVRRPIPYEVDDVYATLAAQDFDIVFLWRRDLVARLDSEIRFRIGRGLKDDVFETLSTQHCLDDFKMQIASARRILRRLEEEGCRKVSCFDYEDLVADERRMVALYEALGVSDDGTRIPSKPPSPPRKGPSVRDHLSPAQLETYSDFALDA